MQHLKYNYYRFIPGDESFPEDLYDEVASRVQDGDIICEVGCFMGRTTALMLELLNHYNKITKFYAIDMFGTYANQGDDEPLSGNMPWGEPIDNWSKRVGGTHLLIDYFDFYMESCPWNGGLTDRVQFSPWHSSEEFDDESVFFTMLNIKSSKELRDKQVEKWLPKIKKGGFLAYVDSDGKVIKLNK